MGFAPVDGVPLHPLARGRTSSGCCCHLLSPLSSFASRSRDERPDGSQPACAWGDVASRRNPYPPDYRMAFASSILLFPHAYRLALRLTFPRGRRTGFPCSVSVTTHGVGALFPPVACDAHDKEGETPCTRYSALLAQALPTPRAERGHGTSNTCSDMTFTIRAWSLRTVIRSESAPVSIATTVICFLSSRGWPRSLVTQDQTDVSALARGVMSPVGATPIHPMTGWRSLLPSSSSRTSISLPCGVLSLTGDVRGSHVPSQSQRMG